MAKTKAELEQEIQCKNEEIKALKCEVEKANRVESKNESAAELYEMYQSYVTAGFTEEQAFELTCRTIPCGNKI